MLEPKGFYTKVSEVIDTQNHEISCSNIVEHPHGVILATGGLVQDLGCNFATILCGGQGYLGDHESVYSKCYYLTRSEDTTTFLTFDLYHGPRTAAASIVIDNGITLWVTGGMGQNFADILATSEYISVDPTPSAQKGPDLVFPLESHCMVRLNDEDHAMVIGGYSGIEMDVGYYGGIFGSEPESRTWIFNFNQWTEAPTLNFRRKNLACGVLLNETSGQKLVMVAGGIAQDAPNSTAVEYLWLDLVENEHDEWLIETEALCQPTVGASSVVTQDQLRLILIGGRSLFKAYPYHKSLCSCQMLDGKPACHLMHQELKNERVFSVAMLIPDELFDCA